MLTAVVFLCGVVAWEDAGVVPPVTPADPPAWFTRLLPSLKVGVLSKADCASLVNDPLTRPYIAAAILGEDQPRDKVLNAAFRDSVWADRTQRRWRWQEQGRIDLIAEAAVVAGRADPEVANEAVNELSGSLGPAIDDRLPAVLKAKSDPWTEQENEDWEKRWKFTVVDGLPWHFANPRQRERPNFTTTYSWPTLRFGVSATTPHVLSGREVAGAAALADRIEFHGGDRFTPGLLVASEAIVNANPKSSAVVGGAVLWSNGPATLAGDGIVGGSRDFVLVADGDVTLPGGYYTNVLVIARRSIRVDGGVEGSGGFYIAGDTITADKPFKLRGSPVLLAANGVVAGDPKVAGPDRPTGFRHAGIGPADLGLRWFELADVGLEVVGDGKDVVVKRIAEKSPFRTRVEPKDVLKAVNGVKVTTADETRRAVRRAVVLGHAVLDLERDGQPRNRLVRVEDVMR